MWHNLYFLFRVSVYWSIEWELKNKPTNLWFTRWPPKTISKKVSDKALDIVLIAFLFLLCGISLLRLPYHNITNYVAQKTEIYSWQFWSLEVQDQGVSRLCFSWGLPPLTCSWGLFCCVLTWSFLYACASLVSLGVPGEILSKRFRQTMPILLTY